MLLYKKRDIFKADIPFHIMYNKLFLKNDYRPYQY